MPPTYSDALPAAVLVRADERRQPDRRRADLGRPGGICYAEQRTSLTDLADVAFAVQFTADTPLAVERAIVETWKLLR